MLGDVQETIYLVDEDDDPNTEVQVGILDDKSLATLLTKGQTIKKQSEMLFVRGDQPFFMTP